MSDLIIPVVMPKWGLTMKEGLLAAWHVEEGTNIAAGDEIMDVETDKIANVVEAADGGLLRRKVGEEGETYPCQAVLGILAPEEVSEAEIDEFLNNYVMPEVEEDEEDTGPAYEYAELSCGRIRYEHRDGEGTPIVLVHGFGGDLGNWIFNIDALAGHGPVYAVDLPGHGQSVKAIESPSIDIMVKILNEFLDSVGISSAHLVGHSMGGLISGKLALAQGDKVESLCLIGSAGLGNEINGDYIDGFVNAASRRELKPKLVHLFNDPGLVSRSMIEDLMKYKRLDGVQDFIKSLSNSMFPNGKQSLKIADELSKFGKPILVIWGKSDAIISSDHANNITGATVNIIEGAGHNVQLEQASKVNESIIAHIS
jgi:pyruvate dehydrogenase E2 component (dihydrolipoamide acetyltransferase)